MTSKRCVGVNPSPRYIQPKHFANHLSGRQKYALFLDIDGTLADFTLNPKDSFIPRSTLMLLQQIQNSGVKIAIVTGRSLDEAKQMLAPLKLPIAATHGLEVAFPINISRVSDVKASMNEVNTTSVNIAELTTIKQDIVQASHIYNHLRIEDKPYSVALHFRKDPALADVAYNIMTKTLTNHPNWVLKAGKYVWEIVPKGADKGSAIVTLLKNMSADDTLCPIFIGDDVTDEAGFTAVQEVCRTIGKAQKAVRGMGIKVGCEATCAHYHVNNISEVTVLLSSFLKFCQTYPVLSFERADVDASLFKTMGG